jgi:hypothetical protein
MRLKILGLAAALGVASLAPAGAADLRATPCHGCGHHYYRPPVAAAEPVTPYYFVNQGPTYSGPGNVVMMPVYKERTAYGDGGYSAPYYDYSYRDGPWADPKLVPYYHRVHLSGYGPVVRALD